jgi:hypothetical protein
VVAAVLILFEQRKLYENIHGNSTKCLKDTKLKHEYPYFLLVMFVAKNDFHFGVLICETMINDLKMITKSKYFSW